MLLEDDLPRIKWFRTWYEELDGYCMTLTVGSFDMVNFWEPEARFRRRQCWITLYILLL